FVDRYPQRRDALVERSAAALDARSDFKRTRSREVIAATLRFFQRLRAKDAGQVETARADPRLRQIQGNDALHDRVATLAGDLERPREAYPCFPEVSGFRVKHSHVVEDPGQRFGIAGRLESGEAFRIKVRSRREIAVHVRKHAAILLDHSQKSSVAYRLSQCRSLGVESLRFLVLAASLADYRLAGARG